MDSYKENPHLRILQALKDRRKGGTESSHFEEKDSFRGKRPKDAKRISNHLTWLKSPLLYQTLIGLVVKEESRFLIGVSGFQRAVAQMMTAITDLMNSLNVAHCES